MATKRCVVQSSSEQILRRSKTMKSGGTKKQGRRACHRFLSFYCPHHHQSLLLSFFSLTRQRETQRQTQRRKAKKRKSEKEAKVRPASGRTRSGKTAPTNRNRVWLVGECGAVRWRPRRCDSTRLVLVSALSPESCVVRRGRGRING
jgi:hypothetical protein